MAEPSSGLPRWLGLATQVAAPVTLVSTLLFYFGYVYTRAQYAYFGVDVDTIGLVTRDYVMRSPQPLLVPLLVLTVVSVAVVALRGRVDARVRVAREEPSGGGAAIVLRAGRAVVGAGVALLVAGLVLLVAYAWWSAWPYLTLVSAVLIGFGAVTTAIALPYVTSRAPGTVAGLWVVVVAAAFWAVSITADWSGNGRAQEIARDLGSLPAVILDSPTDLRLRNTVPPPADLCLRADGGVDEACAALTDEPRYRYRFRLLVQGPDAMFLVPATWSASATTLMVPDGAPVRVQFQFVNVPPG